MDPPTTTSSIPSKEYGIMEEKKGSEILTPTYDTEVGIVQEYGTVRDGIELHPRPTTDPLDPLNFSRGRKWTCLAIVMTMYFLFTYITTATVPSFGLIQEQYNISFAQVNWTVAIPALGLSVGPLVWSSLADIVGRRLVFIVGTAIALVSTIGAALAPNYGGYMAARFFQGFGVAPGSTVGMAIVNDLFFEHERGQKLGLWVLAIDMGLLVGPLIGGFVTLIDQYWVQWLTAIFFGVLLIAEFFFLPETLYPRSKMLARLSASAVTEKSATNTVTDVNYDDIPRTKSLSLIHVNKVPGVVSPRMHDSLIQFFKLWTFPNISIVVFCYCFAWYWWILSVITYLPVAYSQYSPQIQGLLFIGLILGTLVSEILFSGSLSDKIMCRFASRNNNVRVPEHRLWLFYPAILLTSIGLILWGVSVDKGYHWIVGQIAFFMFAAGIQVGNTVTSAYIVDCYQMHAMSVVTFYAVLLNLSAFVNPFFIAPWCDNVGFTWTFAAQGLVTLLVMVPMTVGVQKFGARMRVWRGPPSWTSPEYAS